MILEKLKINAQHAWKMASNWVMAAASTLGTVWFAMPAESQSDVLAHLFFPMWIIPVALGLIGVLARLWPQKSITPEVAAAKSEFAPLPEIK